MDASLWLDELSTLWAVEAGLADVMERVPGVMGQSPFYFGFVWLSLEVLGESEAALRLPSLVAVISATMLIFAAGRALGGQRAGIWSAVTFWVCYPAVWASVDARPYGLAMACGALAIVGVLRICQSHQLQGRVLWVLGSATLVWTNFVFMPFLLGLWTGVVLSATVRSRYPIRCILIDAGILAVLLLGSLPQLASIFHDRENLDWLLAPRPLGVVGQIAPFLAASLFPVPSSRTADQRAIRLLLWLAIAAQLVSLNMGSLIGVDVAVSRYAGIVIVAASLLAGETLSRLKGADLTVPILLFTAITIGCFYANYRIAGSLSGAGYQEWREAVHALRIARFDAPNAPILFRSGNAEDVIPAPGAVQWGATLAPLRSPGTQSLDGPIIVLPYRWSNPARSAYFDRTLARQLEQEQTFFVLCLFSSEAGANGYCPNVEQWIDQTWPAETTRQSLGFFRQLMVLRVTRHPGTAKTTPSLPH